MGLSEEGIAMVKQLRDGLLVVPRVIYASPLVRTQETATILNERFDVEIVNTPELVERDFGSLSGRLRSELDHKIVEDDLEGRYDYHPYGGESAEDVRLRVLKFLGTLPLESNDIALVVTHRGVIRMLYDLYPTEVTGDEIVPASKHIFRVTKMPAS